MRYANEECESQGGGAVTFALDTVRRIDLTGDGHEDYIVDFRNTKCGYVRSHKIVAPPMKRGAARTIRFDLHGSYCGGFGAQARVKERAISVAPFAFKQP
ncbi:hypothetical protein [Bradyrhizobium sp. SSUT77]|uniref:hypothetical protein n=1 Tax=Bradyrhizobium sp. SSUT77 TaxID=3040603 RepID=UPI00244A2AAB|nr:hypothetical protein [Bradyrhizobium sp. SSUT77]MDH2342272.1 hypothetical protein [Bradyrhizobium sp. SSUT77]